MSVFEGFKDSSHFSCPSKRMVVKNVVLAIEFALVGRSIALVVGVFLETDKRESCS